METTYGYEPYNPDSNSGSEANKNLDKSEEPDKLWSCSLISDLKVM